jgi:FkbM family methyltransferase
VTSSLHQTLGGRVVRAMRPVLRRFDARLTRWSKSYGCQRQRYLHDSGVAAVVDVGANAGQYGAELRADGYRGRLLSVEPLEGAFQHLALRCAEDPLWDCVHCGLGARQEESILSVSANGFSSSLLPILDSHVEAAPESRYQDTQTVQIRTLDAVVDEWECAQGQIGLKLDVQGYEAEVLRGAGATLPRVSFLEIELSLVRLYAGQPLFTEMVQAASALGFSLVNVEAGFSDPRTGRVLQIDGIFLRSLSGTSEDEA